MNAFVDVVRAELFKVVRKRRTYVVAGLWWGLLPIVTLIIGRVLQSNLGGSFVDEAGTVDMVVQAVASPFGLARIALVGPAYLSPTFYIIVAALFAALLIGEERGHAMWKTVLVAQPQRLAVLFGKVAVAMIVLAGLLAGALLASVLVGAIGTTFLSTTWEGPWGELVGLYAAQWAFSLAAVTFAFLMVFITRNVALGMVLVFFLPPLLEGLYAIYRTVVGFQPVNRLNVFFQTIQLRQTLEDLPRYFFTNNLYFPARSPVTELIATFGDLDGGGGSPADAIPGLLGGGVSLLHAALVMAGYTLVFGVILVWRFARHDVD
ncbi:MAG: ABC transporter permease [Trueperaceae bacterium]|nr:ABC transporter permease [Trueperaceae bacterium]